MMALCLLSVTYYAQNYAGIIGWSLVGGQAVVLVFIYVTGPAKRDQVGTKYT